MLMPTRSYLIRPRKFQLTASIVVVLFCAIGTGCTPRKNPQPSEKSPTIAASTSEKSPQSFTPPSNPAPLETTESVAKAASGDPEKATRKEVVGGNSDHPRIETKETRWPSGPLQTRIEGYFDSGGKFIIHGAETAWYENEQKKFERHFVQGQLHGTRTAWFEDGKVRSVGEYLDGKSHGTWKEWFSNGNMSQEINFDHGAWHGLYTEWHLNGQKKREVQYVNGKPQLPERIWKEDGTEIFKVSERKPESSGH
jgi:antitoxin component YwqK of YwqJK toxin-antitoxin module